jgi:hypothetical protein
VHAGRLTTDLYAGELFDAFFRKDLRHIDRIRSALRAKFFLQAWRDHIVAKSNDKTYGHFFNLKRSFISPQAYKSLHNLCDALIKLVLVHRKYYPKIAFVPWFYGTHCLEHLFALARSFLPNFTYAEFLLLLRHIHLRQISLLSLAKAGVTERARDSKTAGYVFDGTLEVLTEGQLKHLTVWPSDDNITDAAEVAMEDVTGLMVQVRLF